MNQFLGLKLKLKLADGSLLEGTVHSINDSTQELALRSVKMMVSGRVVGQFPELTVDGKEVKDVEIISASGSSEKKNASASGIRNASASSTHNANGSSTSSTRASSTRSKNTHPQQAFPTGNARQSLPAGDFDFAASLQRFDKARVFSEIAQTDSVRPEERLVSINSPMRKLGINEDVLEGEEARNSVVRAQERKAQLLKLQTEKTEKRTDGLKSIPSTTSNTTSSRSVLIVEDSESEAEAESVLETYGLPQRQSCEAMTREQLLTASLNLAHFLLPELQSSAPSMLLVLLGVEEESVVALQLLLHLTRHGRLDAPVYACFAVGGAGRKIELPQAIKTLKSQLAGRVTFISSLSDLCSKAAASRDVVVIDALRDRSGLDLLSPKTSQTISTLLHQLLDASNRLHALNGSVLCSSPRSRIPGFHLVALGLPQRGVFEAMPRAQDLLIVETGAEEEEGDDVQELFKETFVCEIEY